MTWTWMQLESANGIVAGDFTNDGRDDLLIAGASSGTTRALIQSTNGTFGAPATLAQPTGAIVRLVDVEGDGDLDLVTRRNGIEVYLNRPQGLAPQSASYVVPTPAQYAVQG